MIRRRKSWALIFSLTLLVTSVASGLPADFIRGDANEDGKVTIADARVIFGYLFLGNGATQCLKALDANDDGIPDTSPISGPTSDIAALNALASVQNAAGNPLRFVRFNVLFDIDAQLQGLTPTNPIPSLEFLRLPFRY